MKLENNGSTSICMYSISGWLVVGYVEDLRLLSGISAISRLGSRCILFLDAFVQTYIYLQLKVITLQSGKKEI